MSIIKGDNNNITRGWDADGNWISKPSDWIDVEVKNAKGQTETRNLLQAKFNPWYVLATIFGEQNIPIYFPTYDEKIDQKNIEFWNQWAASKWVTRQLDETRDDYQTALTEYQRRLSCNADFPNPDREILLANTYFSKTVYFKNAIFTQYVSFENTTFAKYASFKNAAFTNIVFFYNTIFTENAFFENATFKKYTFFQDVIFEAYVNFQNAAFSDFIVFQETRFENKAQFNQSQFTHQVPNFHGSSELYSDTQFSLNPSHWPRIYSDKQIEAAQDKKLERASKVDKLEQPPKNRAGAWIASTQSRFARHRQSVENLQPATEQKNHYERLRFLANKAMLHDEERFFERQIMCCKEAMDRDDWRNWPSFAASKLYGWFGGYGTSWQMPLIWLILAPMLFAVGYCSWTDSLANWQTAIETSFANAYGFLGLKRLILGEYYAGFGMSTKIAMAIQSVLSLTLLFLFGLGIRSRFRVK